MVIVDYCGGEKRNALTLCRGYELGIMYSVSLSSFWNILVRPLTCLSDKFPFDTLIAHIRTLSHSEPDSKRNLSIS